MEVIYPKDKGYKGFFLVGFRKDPDTQNKTQRTGTIILKQTYDVNPVAGALNPSKTPLPLFMKDQPDNLLINSGFESKLLNNEDKPICWQPDGVKMSRTEPDNEGNRLLQVSGAANGRIVQTIAFDDYLGGRQFTFSLSAKADDTPAQIKNVQLEADGQVICLINKDLGTTINRFAASGTWPVDLKAKEMHIVLRMATDAARTIWYDKVQVEERSYRTVWDPQTTLRYEHDLAPYKPEGDVIVLGFTDVAGRCLVKVNENIWLERNIKTGNGDREKALFGWEPRVGSDREGDAGPFSDNPNNYPPEWPVINSARDPLPVDPNDFEKRFKNRFYNGYRRSFAVYPSFAAPLLPYLPRGARIEIERNTAIDYSFTLRPDTASAVYYYYGGTGLDEESNWLSGAVTMNLDTLVIEPEKNLCYVVWRGVWLFDKHDESAYRRLVVKVSD